MTSKAVSRSCEDIDEATLSEVVVYDDCGNAVVKCPTEQEAKEYIRNLESEAKDDDI